MPRLRWTRLLSFALVSVMPLGVLAPGCTAAITSSAGQKISCTDTGTGLADCHPVEGGAPGSGSDTCEDVDDDGDGTPHDDGEDVDDDGVDSGASADLDHDSTPDSADDDDDDDGVSDDRDCDKRPGGDDDDDGDDAADHDGSDSD